MRQIMCACGVEVLVQRGKIVLLLLDRHSWDSVDCHLDNLTRLEQKQTKL